MKKMNHVESLLPGSGRYSLKADLRLDVWAMVALVTHLACVYLIAANLDWPTGLKVAINLVPLVPIILYGFKFKRFICGLDELQRRIQIEILLFSALGTLLIGMIVSVLNRHGVPVWIFEYGLSLPGVFLPMLVFWFIGSYLAHWFYSRSDEK